MSEERRYLPSELEPLFNDEPWNHRGILEKKIENIGHIVKNNVDNIVMVVRQAEIMINDFVQDIVTPENLRINTYISIGKLTSEYISRDTNKQLLLLPTEKYLIGDGGLMFFSNMESGHIQIPLFDAFYLGKKVELRDKVFKPCEDYLKRGLKVITGKEDISKYLNNSEGELFTYKTVLHKLKLD